MEKNHNKVVAQRFSDYEKVIDQNINTSCTDKEGTILYVSQSFCDATGYRKEELIGKNHRIFRSRGVDAAFYKEMWTSILAGHEWRGEVENQKKDGTLYWVDLRIFPNYGADGQEIVGFTAIRQDITAQKEAEKLKAEIDGYLNVINEHIITLKLDLHGCILSASNAFCRFFKCMPEDIIGVYSSEFMSDVCWPFSDTSILPSLNEQRVWKGEIRAKDLQGEAFCVEATLQPEKGLGGKVMAYNAVFNDVTAKKQAENLATRDGLTGVYNRHFYNKIVSLPISERKHDWVNYLIIDVDNFKEYNDTYGHHKGDDLLVQICKVLDQIFRRKNDYVFRVGGDEFVVIYTTKFKVQAKSLAEEIQSEVEKLKIQHLKNMPYGYATLSLGLISQHKVDAEDSKMAFKKADKALYISKMNGRNQLTEYGEADTHI